MPIARTIDEREYVLRADRELPEGQRTVFMLRPLTTRQQVRMQDKVKRNLTETIDTPDGSKIPSIDNINELSYERVLIGLVGWSNFKYADGSACVFDQADREGNLNKLEVSDIHELSVAIMDLSILDEGAVKN